MPLPTPDFAAARRAMIESQLRPQGVTDRRVLAAMAAVPREQFVPEAVRPLAYSDRPLPLDQGRSLMSPAAFARLLTEVAPKPGERALVVGAGSGYAAAVLMEIGLDVDSADSLRSPAKQAYDLILVDGAIEEVPQELVAGLVPGGRLAAGIADRGVTRLAVGRGSGGSLGMKSFADCEVPMLPGFSRPRAFTF